jgi:hypothetical protein
MRYLITALIFLLLPLWGCEDVVEVDLPESQNLIVVEGWISNDEKRQELKITRSIPFSSTQSDNGIDDASVTLQSNIGESFAFDHIDSGLYASRTEFSARELRSYTLDIVLVEGDTIKSLFESFKPVTEIIDSQLLSFLENDPDNPSEQIRVFYPKIIAEDSAGFPNFYRWRFFRNGELYTDPESITIQDDRFFDGNAIPNTFDKFGYSSGDTIVVELQSISKNAFEYLFLLKSQVTTLGTSSGTTPSIINGNMVNISTPGVPILGFLGVISVDRDTLIAN